MCLIEITDVAYVVYYTRSGNKTSCLKNMLRKMVPREIWENYLGFAFYEPLQAWINYSE